MMQTWGCAPTSTRFWRRLSRVKSTSFGSRCVEMRDVYGLIQRDASFQSVLLAGEQAVVERWGAIRAIADPTFVPEAPCHDTQARHP